MAGGAKRHKIIKIIGAAFRKRFDVVNFLSGCDPSMFPALLTERMGGKVSRADLPPHSAVTFAGNRVALVMFVPFGFFFGMFLAEPPVR